MLVSAWLITDPPGIVGEECKGKCRAGLLIGGACLQCPVVEGVVAPGKKQSDSGQVRIQFSGDVAYCFIRNF